jgi:hypothetical protein
MTQASRSSVTLNLAPFPIVFLALLDTGIERGTVLTVTVHSSDGPLVGWNVSNSAIEMTLDRGIERAIAEFW